MAKLLADLLLQKGVDLSFYDSNGTTTMMLIFQMIQKHQWDSNTLDIIRLYLPHLIQLLADMDVNHEDADGYTLLDRLIDGWNISSIRMGGVIFTLIQGVLDAGGDPTLVVPAGGTSLWLALQGYKDHGHVQDYQPIFKVLRCRASDLMKVTDATTGDSHLHVIIRNWGNSHKVSELIRYVLSEYYQHGGDISAMNLDEETIFSLLTTRLSKKPDDLDNQTSSHLLTHWLSGWQSHLAPYIRWLISHYLPNDLGCIIVEYIDGSGKPFDSIQQTHDIKE